MGGSFISVGRERLEEEIEGGRLRRVPPHQVPPGRRCLVEIGRDKEVVLVPARRVHSRRNPYYRAKFRGPNIEINAGPDNPVYTLFPKRLSH